MNNPRPLPPELRPKPIGLILPPDDAELVAAAEQELTQCARADENGCFGYFPGLDGEQGIHSAPDVCKKLASRLPYVTMGWRRLDFNFLRLSSREQSSLAPYHWDTDAATAVTGQQERVHDYQVWRLLLNLSSRLVREVAYLDYVPNPDDIYWEEGYLEYRGPIQNETIMALPPRRGTIVHGIEFCANQLLHSGRDGTQGHFVAAYGCEELAA